MTSPLSLHIDQIAGTMASEWKIHGMAAPNQQRYNNRPTGDYVHQITDPDSSSDSQLEDSIELTIHRVLGQQSDSPTGCFLCEKTDHRLVDCPKLVSHVLAALRLTDNPRLGSIVIAKLGQFRTHSSLPAGSRPPFRDTTTALASRSRRRVRPAGFPRPAANPYVVNQVQDTEFSAPADDDGGTYDDDDGYITDAADDFAPIHRVSCSTLTPSDLDSDPFFENSIYCMNCNDATVPSAPGVISHETVDHDCDDVSGMCPSCVHSVAPVLSFGGTGPLAHIDGGSAASTTDNGDVLWHYRPYHGSFHLNDAGGHIHTPVGVGYIKLPTTISRKPTTPRRYHVQLCPQDKSLAEATIMATVSMSTIRSLQC